MYVEKNKIFYFLLKISHVYQLSQTSCRDHFQIMNEKEGIGTSWSVCIEQWRKSNQRITILSAAIFRRVHKLVIYFRK